MTAYVPEEFTSDEADVLRRYFTNLDGPVFALVNLPEVVKGALFARYSRSAKSLRRLFLDEFVGDLDISGDHTVDATVGVVARRGAVREGVRRVRRRLGGPARRRPPGVRAGVQPVDEGARVGPADELPRAEHALHRLRRPPRRPLPLPPRPGRAGEPLRHPLRRRHGPAVRRLQPHPRRRHRPRAGDRRAAPRRQRLRVPPGDPGQGPRRGARDAAGGVAVQPRHLRQRAGVRGPAAAHARRTRCPRPATTPS